MRKWMAIVTVLALMFSLVACSGNGDSEREDGPIRTVKYHGVDDDSHETQFDTTYWKMPFAREDDGLLTRDGYVLLGYSYNRRGTGELIRPGYKYELKAQNKPQHLYCVWKKETKASDFTVEEVGLEDVYITAYKGHDKVVYIPRKIGEKNVTGIATGAFSQNESIREVHITSSVLTVEYEAFASCPNLKTVTLYDNLEYISDLSFEGSPIQTVRLCAGQAPRYMQSLATFGKKYERLMQTEGEKRLIFLAGSNLQYGVDCDYIQTLFQNEYAAVNFGTDGNMTVAFFLDAISPLLTKKDVVVFAPEQYGPYAYHVNGNNEMTAATFQGIATCYNLLENVNVSNYTGVFGAIAQYCRVAANMPALSWDEPNKFLDEYGDLKTLTDQMNSPTYRKGANGYFHFDDTVIPADFIPHLNRVIDTAKASGATVVFTYPSVNRNNVEASSLNESAFTAYNNWIAKTVHCQLIGDVRNYIYNGEYFYNTDYHLNAVGRKLHTKRLAADLIAANIGVK
ncbi:MAG: leucine-rich repeat protein [Clostridia bacterium]|nr:leucine-rich repeat protein [Clostridia bacterium]